MSGYHVALAIAALVVLWLSRKTPRAWLWVLSLAASFVVSVSYLRYYENIEIANVSAALMPGAFEGYFPYVNLFTNWLPPSLIAGGCDALVCVAIMMFGQEQWERPWLFRLMLTSVAVNLVYSSGLILGYPPVPDQNTLGIILEIINYLALLLIGGTGLVDRAVAWHGSARAPGAFRGLLRACRAALRAPTRHHAFWQG